MKGKRIVALLVALLFTLSVVGLGFATELKGTVTKIEGKKITIKDEKGKETTVEVKDLGGAKVGDTVEIKDGKVTVKKPKTATPGY